MKIKGILGGAKTKYMEIKGEPEDQHSDPAALRAFAGCGN